MGFVSNLVWTLIVISIVGAFLSLIAQNFADKDRFSYTTEDTFGSAKIAIPHNLTLTQEQPKELLSVNNCSGGDLAATNYTDYVSAGFVELKDNASWPGSSVCVRYGHGAALGTAAYLLVGAVVLFVVIGIVWALLRKYGML